MTDNKVMIDIDNLKKLIQVPRVTFSRIKRMSISELSEIYEPFLARYNVNNKTRAKEFVEVLSSIVKNMNDEIVGKTMCKIFSGNIDIGNQDELDKLPLYRYQEPDGIVTVKNIPDEIQWYLSAVAYINEKYGLPDD